MRLYAVHDSVAGEYLAPFSASNDAEAIRGSINLIFQPNSKFGHHHADFSLHRLADFNQEQGVFTAEAPAMLVTFSALHAQHVAARGSQGGSNVQQ